MGPARGAGGHAAGVRHTFMTWSDRSDMQRKAACQEDPPHEAGQALPASDRPAREADTLTGKTT